MPSEHYPLEILHLKEGFLFERQLRVEHGGTEVRAVVLHHSPDLI